MLTDASVEIALKLLERSRDPNISTKDLVAIGGLLMPYGLTKPTDTTPDESAAAKAETQAKVLALLEAK